MDPSLRTRWTLEHVYLQPCFICTRSPLIIGHLCDTTREFQARHNCSEIWTSTFVKYFHKTIPKVPPSSDSLRSYGCQWPHSCLRPRHNHQATCTKKSHLWSKDSDLSYYNWCSPPWVLLFFLWDRKIWANIVFLLVKHNVFGLLVTSKCMPNQSAGKS